MVSCRLLGASLAIVVLINFIVFTIILTPRRPAPPEYEPLEWWEHGVLYQVYVRSFKDSDGDGIGDLRGVINELEHFVDAGVDAIWLSPIFTSPMADIGYDVSDFYSIDPQYGTIDTFHELIENAHQRGIKVVLDIPPNHASTKSEYFTRSEERDGLYEDFFVWADPLVDPDGSSIRLPPSNWESQFGGSAWEWSEKRQQYYLHQFSAEQADFNHRNIAVKREMESILSFWLDNGVDGIRLGALPFLVEADPVDHGGRYPDNPWAGLIPLYNIDQKDLYEHVYSWRRHMHSYYFNNRSGERVLITEAYTTLENTMMYYGNDEGVGAHIPFNFNLITKLSRRSTPWDYVDAVRLWTANMPRGAIPNWVLGNHDNSRVRSRLRDNMVDGLNALLMFLPGVAVTYQGEEIGMRDGHVSWEDTRDIKALNRGEENYLEHTRDPSRTPYHWDGSISAGFSRNTITWLPVAIDYLEINLARQKQEAKSHYKFYQDLTALRKLPTFSHGHFDTWIMSSRTVSFVRDLRLRRTDTYILIFNISEDHDVIDLLLIRGFTLPATVAVASVHSLRNAGDRIRERYLGLSPGEALIIITQLL